MKRSNDRIRIAVRDDELVTLKEDSGGGRACEWATDTLVDWSALRYRQTKEHQYRILVAMRAGR